ARPGRRPPSRRTRPTGTARSTLTTLALRRRDGGEYGLACSLRMAPEDAVIGVPARALRHGARLRGRLLYGRRLLLCDRLAINGRIERRSMYRRHGRRDGLDLAPAVESLGFRQHRIGHGRALQQIKGSGLIHGDPSRYQDGLSSLQTMPAARRTCAAAAVEI